MAKVDYTFKILMLGAASTGKTTLSDRYITGLFDPDIRLTVGVEFYIKRIDLDGESIKLQIWDMGGEERFRFLLPTYSLGSSGALFLYDITRKETLDELNDWISIVRAKNGDIPILILGNKVDLFKEREVSKELGAEICNQNNFAGFFETSAKKGINVENSFQKLTKLMLERIK